MFVLVLSAQYLVLSAQCLVLSTSASGRNQNNLLLPSEDNTLNPKRNFPAFRNQYNLLWLSQCLVLSTQYLALSAQRLALVAVVGIKIFYYCRLKTIPQTLNATFQLFAIGIIYYGCLSAQCLVLSTQCLVLSAQHQCQWQESE